MTDPLATPVSPQPEQPLLTIGDITVSQNWVVIPQGSFPLRGSVWSMQDYTQHQRVIPTYAIVLTVVFSVVLCLLGLLFLLIKEDQYTGFIAVSVSGPGFAHTVHLPPGPASAAWAWDQVNRARSLAAAAV